MKKIAIASAAMGGAALIAFGASGTFAAFTDSGSTSGSAGAGTLALGASERITTPAQALSLAPGESTQLAFPVKNKGDLDGVLAATANVVDLQDTCNSSTETASDSNCGTALGDFSDTATVTAYQFLVSDAAGCTTTTTPPTASLVPATTTLRGLSTQGVSGPLASGATTCFVVQISLPASAPNSVQGDSATLTIDLDLTQATGSSAVPGGTIETPGTSIDPI